MMDAVSFNPLDVCDTVIVDGLDARLLVPQQQQILWGVMMNLSLKTLSSGMKRVARDGRAYDLSDFAGWCRPPRLALGRWREAPPVAEVQDEREIALAGMLTRSAPPPAAASGAARGGGGPFYFSTPHGRTVFSIEPCGYCITFNLFHLRLASHSELARLNIMSWNSTLCILL